MRYLAFLLIGVLVVIGSSAGEQRTVVVQPAGDKANDADVAKLRQGAEAFAAAFAKHDAKALAAMWTENGEMHDDGGPAARGRAAIEQAFATLFKAKPKAKIEALIEAIRFPARDLAIEEGVLRLTAADNELPTTTVYRVTHIREGGAWKIAVSEEKGAGQHRLHDLDWLVGTWRGTGKDQEVSLSLTKKDGKPFVFGEFTRKEKGKVVFSGSLKIGIDPQRGQLRSWHFDDDGGHAQALWLRDGNRWVLDNLGTAANGTDVASVTILSRIDGDTFTWRSIDRVMGNEKLPDAPPIRLSRVK